MQLWDKIRFSQYLNETGISNILCKFDAQQVANTKLISNDHIHLRRINFTDHNPGYDQVSERAEDDEEEDAGHRHPGVLGRHVVVLPELDEVHVHRQDDHRHAATERWNLGR